MTWPDRVLLPFAFDGAQMAAALDALSVLDWTPHFVTQNYEGSWSVIALRCAAGATHPITMIYSDPGAASFVDTPMLTACPSIGEVLSDLPFPLQSVRLMRLTPGSIIKTHRDNDLDAEVGRARIHIPITINPEVDFRLNGSAVVMAPGECWYLRLSDPHSVANRGTTDRVHLVVDAVVNDALRRMISPEPGVLHGSVGVHAGVKTGPQGLTRALPDKLARGCSTP